jgi:glycosyltransferase involved in cell wall biosynthesis
MQIVLFCHPEFSNSQSMPRFASMLERSYQERGHQVTRWSPRARIFHWAKKPALRKWFGYVDQYFLFPLEVRRRLNTLPRDTLFVFCDQALGPWVPLVSDRPHVVHAHDLLALRSALGLIPENPTGWSGRVYQRFIRRGFSKARHFICISGRTRDDLLRYGGVKAENAEVIYNGLNYPYRPVAPVEARAKLEAAGTTVPDSRFLLHVGGGQWYKNRLGLLALYAAYAARTANPLPLYCVSPPPVGKVADALRRIPEHGKVIFLQNVSHETLEAMYSLASCFLFPSLAEGFGWPIIEAQACKCPVITTDDAPMSEIAGGAAYLLPRLQPRDDIDVWAGAGADVLERILSLSDAERDSLRERGLASSRRFDSDHTIEAYLAVYERLLGKWLTAHGEVRR